MNINYYIKKMAAIEQTPEQLTDEQMEELANSKKAKNTTYEGRCMYCKIVDCYDGDTVKGTFFDGNKLVQKSFRIYGYDSPEIKPKKDLPNREEHIQKAKEAKAALEELILNKVVIIKCLKDDKYGRTLVNIKTIDFDIDIEQFMLENNHGYAYFGGAKK